MGPPDFSHGETSGSQNDTKYRKLSKNSDIEFDFSKCRKADDIIFINKIIELPFEEIEGKSIIEVRNILKEK